MYSKSLASLALVAFCVLGCSARPHGENGGGEEHDGPHGSMMGGPMMGKVMAAMAKNPFLHDLNPSEIREFFQIKMNTTLTKGQIVSAVNNYLQSLPNATQITNDYAKWQANVTTWKTDMINKLKSNLSADGQALVDKVQTIMEDQSLTYKDTCHQVLAAVNGSSSAVKEELKNAAKAQFGDMMKGKMGGSVEVSGSAGGSAGGVAGNVSVHAEGPGGHGGVAGNASGHAEGPGGHGGPGGMGGPESMGMGGMPGGDPCEMMEEMMEHMGKMASVMHHMPSADDNDDDDAAPAPGAVAAAVPEAVPEAAAEAAQAVQQGSRR